MSNEMRDEVERLEALEAAAKARREELDVDSASKIASLNSVVDQLRYELAELQTYNDQIRNDRANISMERTRLKKRVDDLEPRLTAAQRVIDNYVERIGDLTEERDALTLANKDLTDADVRMTTQIAELGEKHKKLFRVNQANVRRIDDMLVVETELRGKLKDAKDDANIGRELAAASDALRSQNAMLTARVKAYENGTIVSTQPVCPQDIVLLDSIKPGQIARPAQVQEMLARIRSMSERAHHAFFEVGAARTELRETLEKLRAAEDNFRMFRSGDHSPTWALSFLHDRSTQNARLSYVKIHKNSKWKMTWKSAVGEKRIEVVAETMELLNKAVFKAYANDMAEPTDGFDQVKEAPKRLCDIPQTLLCVD